jgi:hypothetical protein
MPNYTKLAPERPDDFFKIAKFFKEEPKKLPSEKGPKYLQQSSIRKPKTSTSNHF